MNELFTTKCGNTATTFNFMTTQTAIKYVQGFISMSHDDDRINEALELAIKALANSNSLIESEFFPVTKPIIEFELSPVRQEDEEIEKCDIVEADFYSVYAAYRDGAITLHDCIANLNNEKEAKSLISLLESVKTHSLPNPTKFVNGVTSWIETHHEVVEAITRNILKSDLCKEPISAVIQSRQQAQGSGGIWELTEELTDKFECANAGRQWDGEFYDEINEFLYKELAL